MILSIIILAFILTTIFWGYMAAASVITKDADRVLIPAFLGILLYYVAYRFLYNYNVILIYKNYSGTSKWGYALAMGIASGLCIEVVRSTCLYFMNKYLKWSGRTKDNVAFAFGYGFCFAIHSLGLYAWSLYSRIVTGNMYFPVENDLLICHLTEVILETIIAISMTFILQYGIIKRKKILYTIIAAVLHIFLSILIEGLTSVINIPRFVGDMISLIFVLGVFFYSYSLVVKMRKRQPDTFTYRNYLRINNILKSINRGCQKTN